MLPEHCENLWLAYLAAEKVRIRTESIASLHAFVAEIQKVPSEIRDRWALDFSRRVVDENEDTAVRFPLFREVLFPALLMGHQRRHPHCARWLAGFSQILYNSPACLAQLAESDRSEYSLLLRALEVDPNDGISRQKLLRTLRSRFEYSLHELPAGVLYGTDGATIEQCNEMEEQLRFFDSLARKEGTHGAEQELLEEARFHILSYRDYLRTRKTGDSYEVFLESKTR